MRGRLVAVFVFVAAAMLAARVGSFVSTAAALPDGSLPGGMLAFTQLGPEPPGGGDLPTAVYVVHTDGSGLRRLTAPGPLGAESPAWSPDGSRIAYSAYGNDYGNDLFVMNRDGSGARQLAHWCVSPTWSPDGRKIACEYSVGGTTIGVIDTRGGQLKLVPNLPQGINPDWSPDGKRFTFEVRRMDRPRGIYIANIDGTHVKRIRPDDAIEPRWSPDGRTILAVRADGSGIYLIPARGGATTLIKADAGSASWSADGTRIAYASGGHRGLHVLDLHSGVDRIVRLRPNVCGTGLGCTEVDWWQPPAR